MGIEINKHEFSADDHRRFAARVYEQLETLRGLLAEPGFGVGANSLGSELELYLVQPDGRPAYQNQEVLDLAADPQLTLELDRYNLEYNLTPRLLGEGGLTETERELTDKVRALNLLLHDRDIAAVPIGILPTLTQADFGLHSMTDRLRYRALLAQLRRQRGDAFEIAIEGENPLALQMSDISLEGANTSFQVHWRINPAAFARAFNAVQLVTPLAVAVSGNSPGIFTHRLWEETRIPLFKQSIDTRHNDPRGWHQPARVSFGQGWVRSGAFELFQESASLFPPLLPCMAENVAVKPVGAPELAELRLHQSTVWLWNRPVYDDADGGHLRIEMRSLPAGPTPVDMVAGAAFAIGTAAGLMSDIDALLPALPFALAERNFYRCAQLGLAAEVIWPNVRRQGVGETPVRDLVEQLLPVADAGLNELGVDADERERYLNVIAQRCASGQTGAQWQSAAVARRRAAGESPAQAHAGMFSDYRGLSSAGTPVAQWPL